MRRVRRRLRLRIPLVAIPLLVAVAVLGYLAGHHHAPQRAATVGRSARAAAVANVVLEYPSDWHALSMPSPLSGLPLTHELLLTPTANPADAGLLAGQLPAGEASPLPVSLLERLATLPRTEVVTFTGGQAYRYAALNLPGYRGEVRIYAIPSQGAAPTALACYAKTAFAADLRRCDQIVAGLTFVGQSQYALTPDAGYAHSLDAVLARLDHERSTLRGELARTDNLVSTRSALASSLAASFAKASAAVSALEPPTAARAAATALAAALLEGRDAYRDLSAGADSLGLPGEQVAQALKSIQQAEANANRALQAFSLLGYRATQS